MICEPKFLVISCVGDESLHRYWSKSSKFDTCLIYYGSGIGYPHESKYYFTNKGPKYHLISDVLKHFSQYTYIWMPDDDIYMDQESVEKLFQINLRYNLSISQPSILGWYGTSVPLNMAGSFIRYVNFVEIMCPCFSKKALQICKKTFTENITGWSIDAAWNVLLNHPRKSMAIIDDLTAIHTRPVFGGDAYKNLENSTLEFAHKDSHLVREKYEILKESIKDVGVPLGDGEIFNAVMYSIEKKMEIDRQYRFWPPIPLFQEFIKDLSTRDHIFVE